MRCRRRHAICGCDRARRRAAITAALGLIAASHYVAVAARAALDPERIAAAGRDTPRA
jgi:hypothetical protein